MERARKNFTPPSSLEKSIQLDYLRTPVISVFTISSFYLKSRLVAPPCAPTPVTSHEFIRTNIVILCVENQHATIWWRDARRRKIYLL